MSYCCIPAMICSAYEVDTVAEDIHAPAYRVALLANPDEVGYIDKKRCGRGEWAKPIPGEGETEGDLGGWRWKWA